MALPNLTTDLSSTSAADARAGNFSSGLKTFGAPGGSSLLGDIGQQVLIGVVVAVVLFYVLPKLKKG